MVYTFYFALLTIGAFIAKVNKNSRCYLFFIMIVLLAIISFRDRSVGADTISYCENYSWISRMSISRMFNYAFSTKEPLYVIISWLPSIISSDFTAYLMVWALFPVISLYKVFKIELKDSIDMMIGMFVFFLLGLYAFFVAGIRQTAALSLVFVSSQYLMKIKMNSFRQIVYNRNTWYFLLFFILAYMIHNSSFLFVLAIPCLFFQVRWWYLLLIIGLFSIGNYVRIDQVVLLSQFFFKERFATYGTVYESSQNMSALIMQLILFFVCFAVREKLIKLDSKNNFYFNLMFLGLVFQSLSGMMAEMARISFYFIMFAMLLVPRAFKLYTGNIKIILYIGFIIVSLYYLFFITRSNLPEYQSIF